MVHQSILICSCVAKTVTKQVSKLPVKAMKKETTRPMKKKPGSTTSQAASSSQTYPLTKDNLDEFIGASGGSMTKSEKVALLNAKVEKDRAGEPQTYTYDETRCLYGRFQTALKGSTEGSMKAQGEMEKINQEGRGKEAKKRTLLRAWCVP